MATQLQIYNRAAVALGRDPVFSDPARVASRNPTGQALASNYAVVLPAAMAAFPWNFACKREIIPALATAPRFGWKTAYEAPADLLRVRDLNYVAGGPREKFAVEGGIILANCTGSANLRWIARVLDVAKFDAEFVEYFAIRLAASCALKVLGSQAAEDALTLQAEKLLVRGRNSDSQEAEPEDDDEDGDWLTFRSSVT